MAEVVTTTRLRKTYDDTSALRGVSLEVDKGDVFALIGPNGAGKTTLVRTITGTVEPDAGSVSLLGSAPSDVDRSKIGVLPQSFDPRERLTARELLTYYAGLYPSSRDPDAVLELVGVSQSASTRYANLSGGQQRRVCVGIALVNDPDVLFLDEPTTGIDPAGQRDVWKLVENLASTGTTVFLTTHYMQEAEYLADEVGVLADGELVALGAPDELINTYGGDEYLIVETPTANSRIESPPEGAEVNDDGNLVFERVSHERLPEILNYVDETEIPYTSIQWVTPGLEEVYLALADGERRHRPDRRRDDILVGGEVA